MSIQPLCPGEQDVPWVFCFHQIAQHGASVRGGRRLRFVLGVLARGAVRIHNSFRIIIINVIFVTRRAIATRRRTLVLGWPSGWILLLVGLLLALGTVPFRQYRSRFLTIVEIRPAVLRVAGSFVITTITTITMGLGRGV